MNIIGIVCEYNPFHKGHAWQMEASRAALGADSFVVCIMSGDYVQRGEAAVFSKFARAEAACRCGADLVFELPLPWALSSAEGFARGSVYMLAALGCTHLCFGSEHGKTDELELLARCLSEPDIINRIKDRMRKDPRLSFASARQALLEEEIGDTAELLEKPNNILAVEYLKAIVQMKLPLLPHTVERRGSGHDQCGDGELRSASELREMLRTCGEPGAHIPEAAMKVFRRETELGRAVLGGRESELVLLSRLRMLGESAFTCLPDGGDGAGRRLFKAVRCCGSLDEIYETAVSRRIPQARVRRMCLGAALGLDGSMAAGLPPYARLLAAGQRGRELLRDMEHVATIPVVTKPASVKHVGAEAEQVFALGASAHDMYTLLYARREDRIAGQDWRTGPKIV